MKSRSLAIATLVFGLGCATALPTRAADGGAIARATQAATAGLTALSDRFAPKGGVATWSAKASGGRHARPRGGKSPH